MPTRRDLLKIALSSGGLLGLQRLLAGCSSKPRHQPPARPGRPRYVIQLLLSGGHDTVYTTDPKTRGEVEQNIDLPAQNGLVEAASLRLGVHFAPLAPHAHRLALVNGVQVGTANHDTGLKQFFRLKTNIADEMPTALDLIGAHRESQPLGVAYLNMSNRVQHSPGYFGYPDRFYFGSLNVFDLVNAADDDDLHRVARALHREADQLARLGPAGDAQTATRLHLEQAAAFFDAATHVPPFYPVQVSTDYTAQSMAESLQRALWLIEHDLTACVAVDLGLLGWDTHQRNAVRQAEMSSNLIRSLEVLLAGLAKKKNAHGTLAEQTLIVAGSDLGRFPRLNDMLGKDHLPQTAYLFLGDAVVGGQAFGQTDKQMAAVPISPRTGKPDGGNRMLILDDIGTTLLHLTGLDPERFGYTGRVLEFLVA